MESEIDGNQLTLRPTYCPKNAEQDCGVNQAESIIRYTRSSKLQGQFKVPASSD